MTEAQARYYTLKAAGVCVTCKGAPRPGKTRCLPCQRKCVAKSQRARRRRAASRRAYMRRRRHAWAAAGFCTRCGGRNLGAKTECRSCRDDKAAEQATRRGHKKHNRCGFCHERGHNVLSCREREMVAHESRVLEVASSRVAL